jgi:tetratricopeptide (TPR) repeat protein
LEGHLFISYAIEDRDTANSLCEFLEISGWQCWLAPRNILPGLDWSESIIDAISQSKLMILVYSESANRSLQVKREVERASNKGIGIVPFQIEETAVSKALEYHLGNAYWIVAISPDIRPHLEFLKENIASLIGDPFLANTQEEQITVKAHSRNYVRRGAPKQRRFFPRSRKARAALVLSSIVVFAVVVVFGVEQWRQRGEGEFETHLNASQNYASHGEFDHALEEINLAIATAPTNWLGYRVRGQEYYQRGVVRGVMNDFSLAVPDLETAIKLNPNDDISRQILGETHVMLRAWDLAEADLNESLKLNPGNVFSRIDRAAVRRQHQNYSAAVADLTEALKLAPENVRALGDLGDVYILMGDYKNAVDSFSRAIRLFPNNAILRLRRSEAYAGLGMTKEAQIDKLEAQKQ